MACPTTSNEPIACTLNATDFQERVAWIRALNAKALRGSAREGLVLHLTYDAERAADVREFVRRESACCAFLRFEMGDVPDGIRVTVTAPEEAREAAETIFADFAAV